MSGHEQWPWPRGPKEAGVQCEALHSPFPWMVPLLEAKWAYNYHITPRLGEGLSASAQATSSTAVPQALEKWLVTPAKAEMTGLDRILLSQGPGRSGSVLPQRPLCLNSVSRGPGLYVSMSSKKNLELRSLPDVQETTLSVSAWPGAPVEDGQLPYSLSCFFSKTSEWVSEVAQSCPTLRDPMDCSLPGSSVHGIFQATILEWVAISFSKTRVEPYWALTMGRRQCSKCIIRIY